MMCVSFKILFCRLKEMARIQLNDPKQTSRVVTLWPNKTVSNIPQ